MSNDYFANKTTSKQAFNQEGRNKKHIPFNYLINKLLFIFFFLILFNIIIVIKLKKNSLNLFLKIKTYILYKNN